ncbi:unnamed protein product [Nezara viridula]|uniref:Malate dehydrogenase, mitochondrial n=1 Tax=Nezara viridula TaxID=85310 RepID=A0A9P0H5I0_NEZVI|nr:unnamed protein product [Nezara viridula]
MNAMNTYIKKEVALIGANTTFGKITSFLLKQSPVLSKLTLYDEKSLKSFDDMKYINTPCKVSFVNGREHISEAIKAADIIIIGDDNPKEMSHEATLVSRVPSFSNYVQQIADHNPNAIIIVATNPVNMTVPLAAEVLRNLGKFDERKLIGMTNVENIKARAILARHLQICPGTIDFPVIGGSTSETSVPLLSNTNPRIPLSKANSQKIICAVKTSATKLHNAEGSQESLNRSYATAKLVKSIVAGLNGHPTVETVLSYQKIINNADYFSLPVLLGENGIINHMTLPNISQHEKHLLLHAITSMAADSKKAKHYYDKLVNNLGIPIRAPQNKLNKLKPPNNPNKHPQSQYASVHNRTQNSFQNTMLNETSPSSMKLKSIIDHVASTISSCNKSTKTIVDQNKLESLKFEKKTKHSVKFNQVNDIALLAKQDSFKGLRPTEKAISAKNTIFEYSTQVLTMPKNIKNLNPKENITSNDPIVNYINKTSLSPQLSNKEKKCVIEKDNLSLKDNNKEKQYTTSENVSTDTSQKILRPEKIENNFTSNIIGVINEMQNRKSMPFATKGAIKNQSENMFDNSTKVNNFSSKFNTKNDKYLDLFGIKAAKKDDKNVKINKADIKSISDISFLIPSETKTSGKKYSLQTNQPHWILHSMLFKSEKYQSSKRPILSRYVSSESHDNQFKNKQFTNIAPEEEMRQVSSLPKPQTNINELQEPLWSRFISSESRDNEIKNKVYENFNPENRKNLQTSLPKSQQNIKIPYETFSLSCKPSESTSKEMENKEFINFNSENKIKQNTSPHKIQTNFNKPHVFIRSQDALPKPNDEGTGKKLVEAINSKENVREVKLIPKSKTNINIPHESIAITSEPGCNDNLLPTPYSRSLKNYNGQRKIYINPKVSSDTCVFENLIQKQKSSISSGHKVASFRTERSEDTFFILQREMINTKLLDKANHNKNKRNDLQKLHLLTSNSKECVTKNKVPENQFKSLGVEDLHCKNNYLKQNKENSMINISKQQISETTDKNMDNGRLLCTTGDKKNNSTYKGERREIDNNSKKYDNSDILNVSSNQVMSTPSKCMQNETKLEINEPGSGKTKCGINDYHICKPNENESCENNSNPSKLIQHSINSKLDSETDLVNGEGVNKIKNSLEHTSPKEIENATV